MQIIVLVIFKASGFTSIATGNTYLIPIGISFYSFQILSYYTDIRNKRLLPEKNIVKFSLYISFFPQILAGPIERASRLIPQFENFKLNRTNLYIGSKFILVGLFRKVIVADKLALIVEPIYNNTTNFNSIILIIGTVLFSFQIYCDFSGYTNIAVGSARLFGVKLSNNFNKPYLAKSMKDFWRRWHITLSEWFRDYVYIPLGGNKASGFLRIQIILSVFILSGIWHGVGLTFLLWGTLHALFYLIEEYLKKTAIFQSLIREKISILFTFLSVSFLWIFFRSHSIIDAYQIVLTILNLKFWFISSSEVSFFLETSGLNTFSLTLILFILLVFLIVDFLKIDNNFLIKKKNQIPSFTDFCFVNLTIVLLLLLGDWGGESFIYFQF